jgi:hypothetical protein
MVPGKVHVPESSLPDRDRTHPSHGYPVGSVAPGTNGTVATTLMKLPSRTLANRPVHSSTTGVNLANLTVMNSPTTYANCTAPRNAEGKGS